MPGIKVVLLVAFVALLALPGRATAQDDGSLVVTVQLERRVYEPGEAIPFTVRIQNAGRAPVTVIFPSSQRFDVVLRSSVGDVARWSSGTSFAQGISRQTWAPGEIVTFTDTWVPRTDLTPSLIGSGTTVVPRGLFTLRAELTGITLKPASRPETIVIGSPVQLGAGCTTLQDTLSADTPLGVMTTLIEPLNSLLALWQPAAFVGGGAYSAFALGIASVNNLPVVRGGVPLTVCLHAPARVTLP